MATSVITFHSNAPQTMPANSSVTSLGLSTDFAASEKGWRESDHSLEGLTQPQRQRDRSEIVSLAFSRSRFVLRLMSATFALGMVGALGNVYAAYNKTGHSQLKFAGEDLWPEWLDLTPSNVPLALGSVISFLTLASLVAGIHPAVCHRDYVAEGSASCMADGSKIRHISRIGDIVHMSVAGAGIILGLLGSLYFNKAKHNVPTLWSWSCSHTVWDHPQVGFGELCGDIVSGLPSYLLCWWSNIHTWQHFAFAMGFAIAAIEMLVLINVVTGCVLVKHRVAAKNKASSF